MLMRSGSSVPTVLCSDFTEEAFRRAGAGRRPGQRSASKGTNSYLRTSEASVNAAASDHMNVVLTLGAVAWGSGKSARRGTAYGVHLPTPRGADIAMQGDARAPISLRISEIMSAHQQNSRAGLRAYQDR